MGVSCSSNPSTASSCSCGHQLAGHSGTMMTAAHVGVRSTLDSARAMSAHGGLSQLNSESHACVQQSVASADLQGYGLLKRCTTWSCCWLNRSTVGTPHRSKIEVNSR